MPESPEFPVCWSCQGARPDSARDMVWITSDVSLPICRPCWSSIEPAERIALAMKWFDRHGEREDLLRDTLAKLSAALDGYDAGPLFGPPPRN